MKIFFALLFGVLMNFRSLAMATAEKPPVVNPGIAGTLNSTSRDMARPNEPRQPTQKDKVPPKKSASKVPGKKETKLNLCDQ